MPTNFLVKCISLADALGPTGFLISRDQLVDAIISTLTFSILGVVLFAIAFWVMGKVTPFSIRKEIEEDQNMALALVIAAVIIGIALIVSAAVHG